MTGPAVKSIYPVFFVRDAAQAAAHYQAAFGFKLDFLFGQPTVFAAVSRGGHRIYLRGVDAPNFASLAARESQLILAMVEVDDVEAVFADLVSRGADIAQGLTRYSWGGTDVHVRDPDGNVFSFVTID
ncbi:MAG: VOC family protein [Polymorphobacter sp.]|uniref:VOC family protein n=1 Tax=Polymorphobacter sp. TaxID=1909290 RepID=UPI003A8972FA